MNPSTPTPTNAPSPPPVAAPPRRGVARRVLRGARMTLVGVAAALVALDLWFALAPPVLDPYAPRLAAFLSQQSGFDVSLTGMGVRGGMHLLLTGQGVRVARPGEREPLFTADSLLLGLSPLAWWQGSGFLEVTLLEADAVLVREPGTWRLGPWTWQGEGGGQGSGMPVLANAVFRNATLRLRDETIRDGEGAPVTASLRDLSLEVSRGEDGAARVQTQGALHAPGAPTPASFTGNGMINRDGRWQGVARVDDVRLDPFVPYLRTMPPLDGLAFPFSLHAEAQGGGGQAPRAAWRLQAGEGVLRWPSLFRWPLPVTSLTAQGQLEKTDGWRLDVSRFDLVSRHGRADGHLAITGLDSPAPVMDLRADAYDVATEKAPFYFPATVMHEDLVHWLDTSLRQGRVVHASAEIRGPVLDVPFLDKKKSPEGIFRIIGEVEGLDVHYYPGLPPVSHARTRVVFDRVSMTAQVLDSTLAGSEGVRGEVRIPDMVEDPVVEIRARADARLESVWKDVIAAPALRWDRAMGLEGGSAAGRGELALELTLPIWRLGESRYHARLELRDAQFTLPFLPPPISRLHGELELDEARLRLLARAAQLDTLPLKGELTVTGFQHPEQARMEVAVTGAVDAATAATWLRPLLGDQGRLEGAATVAARFEKRPREALFRVSASAQADDLGGQGRMGWRKQVGRAGTVQAEGSLGLDGLLTLKSLHGVLGNLEVTGNTRWNLARKAGEITLAPVILGLSQGRVRLSRPPLADLDRGWKLTAILESLDALAGEKKEDKEPEEKPEPPPDPFDLAFDITADRLLLARGETGKAFHAEGEITPHRTRVKTVWQHGGSQSLRWERSWLRGPGQGAYQAKLDVASDNFGHLLRGLDWHQGLAGGRGEVVAELAGEVPPGGRLKDHLHGKGRLEIKEGEIRRLELLSKLLGLLSLTELPNLLAGNRPDLAGEGFYYRTCQGKFTLRESRWHTDKMHFSGPAMDVLVSGDVDIKNKQSDLLIGLRPLTTLDEILTKVPVLGKLVTGSRESLVETQVAVTGSVRDPEVTLQPVGSLAPGIVRDLLELPARLFRGGDATDDGNGKP